MLSALVKLLNSNGNVVKILVKIYAPIVLFHAHLGITKHFCGIQLLSWEKVQNVITFQKVIEELKLNEILEDFTMHNDAIPANSNTCSTKWLLSKCVLNVIKNYAATTKRHCQHVSCINLHGKSSENGNQLLEYCYAPGDTLLMTFIRRMALRAHSLCMKNYRMG